MTSGVGRRQAGVALAAAFALSCALSGASAALAQARGGPPGGAGRPVMGLGGGSFVRVGPDALRSPDASNVTSGHDPSSLREALFGARDSRTMGPPPGRYAADSRDFVIDRGAGDVTLVRFENSQEIWALTPVSAPRGDIIFKNDAGQAVLRATRIGGLTLFTDEQPQGVAVASMGAAPPLHTTTSLGPQALLQALAQASGRASRVAQHLVVFDAPDVRAETDWAFADAAWVTSEAFVRAAQRQAAGARSVVSRFLKVDFAQGRAPDVSARGPELRITVTPQLGPAGRPSSERILMVMVGR